jgi:uncharacterized DUF497 family protein
MNLEWDDEKAAENERKHGVTFEEAAEVFTDPQALEWFDAGHSTEGEGRFIRLGLSSRRLLFVVFTERGAALRTIHARTPDGRMRADYVRHNPPG